MINDNIQNIRDVVIANRDTIPVLDSVIITDLTWGRLDLIVLKHYSGLLQASPEGSLFLFYQLLLDFNNITDPTNLKMGQVIDIPDLITLLEYIETPLREDAESTGQSPFEQKIPGIISTQKYHTASGEIIEHLPVKQNVIYGIPKLKTHSQKKVTYDPETGKAIF